MVRWWCICCYITRLNMSLLNKHYKSYISLSWVLLIIIMPMHLPQVRKLWGFAKAIWQIPHPWGQLHITNPLHACSFIQRLQSNENLWINAPVLGTNFTNNLLQIPTHCPNGVGKEQHYQHYKITKKFSNIKFNKKFTKIQVIALLENI